jgi:hypothetical protein
MTGRNMQQKHWIGIGLLLMVLGGGYYYYTTQIEEPIDVAEKTEDEITREQTEAHMRQIGYVQ